MDNIKYYRKGLVAFAGTVIGGLTWALENGDGISSLEWLAIAGMVVGIAGSVTAVRNEPKPLDSPRA